MSVSRGPRRFGLCWLTALLALPAVAAAQPPAPLAPVAPLAPIAAFDGASQDQRYIITFRSSAGLGDRRALVAAGGRAVAAAGGRVLRRLPSVRAVAAWLPEQALQELRHRPDVELVEVDARRYLAQSGPPWTDTSEGGEITPYGLRMVQADQLSDAGSGSRKVCIIDTGYNRGHDDLQYVNVTTSPDVASGDPFVDEFGHGTHIAGTIAGIGGNGIGVRGINPSQRIHLHIIKAFGKEGTWIYSSDLVHALAQCRAAGANVVSMSFSGTEPVAAEETAFADAYAAGVLSVAAAGNFGILDPWGFWYMYPASYPSVISVAAVDANENVADFSQHNDRIELAAPGVGVLSTLPPPQGYAAWSGTSMATPHVAGVAALIWSYNPSWSNAQIRQALQQTAKDKGATGRDVNFGYGIIRAKAALDFLCGPGCASPPPPPYPSGDCLVDTGRGDFDTGHGVNVDMIGSLGDVRLSPAFVEQAGTLSSTGVGFTTTTWRAQTFTAGVTGTLTAAEIYMSCEDCYGTVPIVQVTVRETSNGAPFGPDLATALTGGTYGVDWRRADLVPPLTVEAGRQYALVVRVWEEDASRGGYQWRLVEADTYAGGQHLVSTNSGSSWSPVSGTDLSFRAHVITTDGPYSSNSGWSTSSLMDSLAPAGGTAQWGTLDWTATLPAGTSIRFQVAGSDSATGLFDFVGPDGTAATFFTTSGAPVSRLERYLRYRFELSTTDLALTPVLHDVSICYSTSRGTDTVLRGKVTDALTGDPIAGAAVNAGAGSATTDASGQFEIDAAPGTYSVMVSAGGYDSTTLSGVEVREGFATSRSVALQPLTGCMTDTTTAHFQVGAASNVDVSSTPGDVQLAQNSGTLDQSQTSTTGGGYSFPTTAWYQAQTFTPAVSGFLRRLQVEMDCISCSGADPDITVEIRNAVGGAPGSTVLATATIAGFSLESATYYTVTFASPPSLTAGTQYAFVLRLQTTRAAGIYVANVSRDYGQEPGYTDEYSGGAAYTTTNGGASWSPHTSDFKFRTYMAAGTGRYVPAGSLESSSQDAGPSVRWTTLSWTASSPASTTARFQVAVSHDASGPFAFVGPDGTANTFFTSSAASLAQLPGGRFAKYKAFLSSSDAAVTPALHDVTLCYEAVEDTTPPSAPGAITSSHDGGAGFGDDTIEIAWQPAFDALSGVDGYSYFFDQSPVPACEMVKDVEEATLQATSGALADGTWYVHVCAVDQAGNWGAVAHGGPYAVDTPCLTDTTLAHFQAGVASHVDLTSRPGDAQLTLTTPSPGSLDQSQTAIQDGFFVTAGLWEAQIFTPGASGFLTRLDLNLWCWFCFGSDPALTVEIRNVAGSAPGDEVLATATIAGFLWPDPRYYTFTFDSPPQLTAGIRYAFVVRSQADRIGGRYVVSSSPDDQYAGGAHRYTADNGSTWASFPRDLTFRTYMAPARGVYTASGTLESPARGRWSTLSWTAASPQSTAVKFQVAASNSASGPFTFVGPDGTPGSFFTTSGASIDGVVAGQYAKYKVFLSTGDAAVTPALHDVTVCYDREPIQAGSFFTVTPCRLLDTRLLNQGPALTSGVPRLLAVPGVCGVPPTATAVALNVAVTQATGAGHLVVYPAGGSLPATSTLNFRAGQTRANNAIVPLGPGDSLGLFAFTGGGSVHAIVDVVGYFE